MSKRTSLKQAKSPLDELFSKSDKPTRQVRSRADLDGASALRDSLSKDAAKKDEKDGFALLDEEIKQKKHEHLRVEDEKKAQLADKGIKKKTGQLKRQTTLIMYGYQLDWLEMKRAEAFIRGGKPISMAKLVRAMVDLLMESPINLAGVKNEAEIKKRLEKGIKKK